MTYPPQGPYGQQPDPYGQQPDPYGQQPDPYGQQPQQPDPYGQQYGGFPQVSYGGLSGGGPQPPKSNKNAILATVVVVVVLLAGVGVTGFVAPGFFLKDDETPTGGGGGGEGETLEDFAKKLVAAADKQDKDALEGFVCDGAADRLQNYVDTIDQTEGAKQTGVEETGDGKGEIKITVTVDGDDNNFTINAAKDGDKWCWDAVDGDYEGTGEPTTSDEETTTEETTEDTTASNGPDQGGEAFLNQFLATLSTGDVAGTQAMLCSDSTDQDDVAQAAPQLPQLTIDPAALVVEDGHVTADLVGTANGVEVTGFLTAFLEDAGWCAYVFSMY